MNSGVYIGPVDSYAVVDANATYEILMEQVRLTLSLEVQQPSEPKISVFRRGARDWTAGVDRRGGSFLNRGRLLISPAEYPNLSSSRRDTGVSGRSTARSSCLIPGA